MLRRSPRRIRRKGAQRKVAAMMTQAAVDCPALRSERIDLVLGVRRELRFDVKREALALDLLAEIADSRSARWRRKTADRASRLADVHRMLAADLAKRDPKRERVEPGRWHYTAIDDSGERVLVAEVRCDVPRSFADPTPVLVTIKLPAMMLDGRMLKRARETAAAA